MYRPQVSSTKDNYVRVEYTIYATYKKSPSIQKYKFFWIVFYDAFNEYNFEPIAQIQEQEQEDFNSWRASIGEQEAIIN